jgi:multiple sugar transport system permease protein
MPILSPLERRSPATRVLLGLAYLLLTLGALTMVYPFLVMVGSAMTSDLDVREYRVLPRYFTEDAALYRKHLEEKYGGKIDLLNALYGSDALRFEEVPLPRPPAGSARLVADWREFLATLPVAYRQPVYRSGSGGVGEVDRRYQQFLARRYGGVAGVNRAYRDTLQRLSLALPPFEELAAPGWRDPEDARYRDWRAFKAGLPPALYVPVSGDAAWRAFLRRRYEDLPALNRAWNTAYSAWSDVTLPTDDADAPPAAAARLDWGEFGARHWPARFVERGPEFTRLEGAENRWRGFLARKYGEIGAANAAFGTNYASLAAVPGPYALNDWQETREAAGALRRHFALRNYATVVDRFAIEGRSLWNTLFFCAASILVALTVNPLCAYALSRFQLPYAFKILLFLLATIAFPAEVSMIPGFLLLKNLGMLNTFWALVLPGAANGYAIFLLKGFFDSLPLDLYEAGMLDGASELTLFTRVTIPLSLPILAVTALGAFTAAYGAFLFALVVCQDPRMWTIMVHVYQIQVDEPRSVLMAALVLASLPTLVVFIFAQRIIMRGIILPSYK